MLRGPKMDTGIANIVIETIILETDENFVCVFFENKFFSWNTPEG